jgi:hypothetical protein
MVKGIKPAQQETVRKNFNCRGGFPGGFPLYQIEPASKPTAGQTKLKEKPQLQQNHANNKIS